MEEKFIAIETKLAFLEDSMATLNELVIAQQKELESLKRAKESVEERLAELEEDVPSQKPPHY